MPPHIRANNPYYYNSNYEPGKHYKIPFKFPHRVQPTLESIVTSVQDIIIEIINKPTDTDSQIIVGQAFNGSSVENEQITTSTIVNESTFTSTFKPDFTEITKVSNIIQNSVLENNRTPDFSETEGSGWLTITDFIGDNIITTVTESKLAQGDSVTNQINWMKQNSTEQMHKPYLQEAGSFDVAYILISLLVGLLIIVCVVLVFVYLKYKILQHKAYNISQTSEKQQYEMKDKEIIDGYQCKYNP